MSAEIEGGEFDEKPARGRRGKGQDYFDELAAAMRERGVTNPRELPDAVVEEIQTRHGL